MKLIYQDQIFKKTNIYSHLIARNIISTHVISLAFGETYLAVNQRMPMRNRIHVI